MRTVHFALGGLALMVCCGIAKAPPMRGFQRPATTPPRFVTPFTQQVPSFQVPSGFTFPPATVNLSRSVFPPMNSPFVTPFTRHFNPFFPHVGVNMTTPAITNPATRLATNAAISQAGLNAAFGTQPRTALGITDPLTRLHANAAITQAGLNAAFGTQSITPAEFAIRRQAQLQSLVHMAQVNTYIPGGGYGGGYGTGGMNSANAGSAMAADYTAAGAVAASPSGTSVELLGFSLDNGQLNWPLGVRILAPSDQTSLLRGRIDALLSLMATQAAAGSVNPALLDETIRSVVELRKRLESRSMDLVEYTYREAHWFLDQLERSLKVMSSKAP